MDKAASGTRSIRSPRMSRTSSQTLSRRTCTLSPSTFIFNAFLTYSFPSPVQTQLNMILRLFMPYLVRIGPAALRRKIVEMAPKGGPSHHMMRISDALSESSRKIVNEKKRALLQGDEALKQQVGEGKDIMSVLREPKHNRWGVPASC